MTIKQTATSILADDSSRPGLDDAADHAAIEATLPYSFSPTQPPYA